MTFSQALSQYKHQKEVFKKAEEDLFSLFRSQKKRHNKGVKSLKTINELTIGFQTERRAADALTANLRNEP